MPPIDIKVDGDTTELLIKGPINEDLVLPEFAHIKSKRIVFDLRTVDYVNSSGIRIWVQWMRSALTEKLQITFRHCTVPVVEQMNILLGFVPRGAFIESIYAPYYCSHCDINVPIELKHNTHFRAATSDQPSMIQMPKNQICTKCKREIVFDIPEKRYFKFLT